MVVSVRMPEIYGAGTPVDALSLGLTVPVDDLPTAKMETVDEIPMHALVEIFTAQGSAGVFRVTDRAAPFGGTRSLSLRGALDTLSDDIFPGTTALSGTVSAVLGSILAQQTTVRWQLGAVCSDAAVKISNSYTDLLSLVNSVRAAVKNTRFVYDFTTTPWTLGLAEMDSTIAGELRIGRNIESASVDISDAELCTRLYMTVTRGSSSSLSVYDNAAAQAEWGIICKTADVNAADVDDPAAYAQEILAERAKPIAYITIEGEDLKNLTGDDFDRLRLGSRCRAVIDGYAEPFVETVTRMEWPDVFGQPDKIRYSLASYLKPFTEQLNLIKKTGAGNARKIEEQERELIRHQADIETSNERILLWATEEEWDEISEEYVETGRSQFDVTSAAITSEVSRATEAEGRLSSRITQEADRISLVVTGTGANAQVNRAGIVLAINGGTGHSTAVIEADQIDINGIVTALAAKSIEVLTLTANDATIGDATIDVNGNISALSVTASSFPVTNGGNLVNSHIGVTKTEANGQVTLTFTKADGSTPDTVTFSRASASRTVRTLTQSGGTVNVGSRVYTVDADIVYSDNDTGSSTIAIPLTIGSYDSTGKSYPLTVAGITGISVSASDAWQAGYDDGEQDMLDMYDVVSVTPGTVSKVGTASVSIPLSIEIGDDLSGNTKTVSRTVTPSVSGLLEARTGTNKITSNGTYAPSSGKLGFSSVEVDVSQTPGSISGIGYQRIMSVPSTPPANYTHLTAMTSAVSSAHGGTYGGYVMFTVNPGGTKYYITIP